MLRLTPVLVVLGCAGGAGFRGRALPELVPNVPAASSILAPGLELRSGESFAWQVHHEGLTIGRAELAVGDVEVRTKFETGMLASAISAVRYELTTQIDRQSLRATAARETLEVDGETTHRELSFDGATYTQADATGPKAVPEGIAHTFHSALGALRAWAGPEAQSGFLFVLHGGRVFRIDVTRPIPEEMQGTRTLKIAARARPHEGGGGSIAFTLWLTANDDRVPLRVEVTAGEKKLTAELIDE